MRLRPEPPRSESEPRPEGCGLPLMPDNVPRRYRAPLGVAHAGRASAGLITAALALLLSAPPSASAQYGDAQLGADLLRERKCTTCHSILGQGGGSAPDLARRSTRDFTPAALAAQMWNHGPAMWQAIAAANITIEPLSGDDVNNLFAYFYSLRFFDPPGDAARGKRIFEGKRCSECHGSGSSASSKPGPSISEMPAVDNPVEWAQQMWNHSTKMREEMRNRGISWPRFTVQEMVDLLVYIGNLPGTSRRQSDLVFAGPETGERLFKEKGCVNCHTLGSAEPGKVDLLGRGPSFTTLTGFAVNMWNHGGRMQERARQTGRAIPEFAADEMSQLVSYLFARRYFTESGNAPRGERLFREKNCAACHGQAGSGAPDLSARKGQFSPATLASALWRHGPKMLAEMQSRNLSWPELTGAQMSDLIAHLNAN